MGSVEIIANIRRQVKAREPAVRNIQDRRLNPDGQA